MPTPFLNPKIETFDIEPEGQRISDLLAGVRGLQRGWFDGSDGQVFLQQSLHWLETQWRVNVPASLPAPKFFPTVDGKLSVEWSIERWDASLEVDLAAKRAYFHALNLDTDVDREADNLDLSTPDGWEGFVNPLHELLGREVDA